jgi:hypothetical protein
MPVFIFIAHAARAKTPEPENWSPGARFKMLKQIPNPRAKTYGYSTAGR